MSYSDFVIDMDSNYTIEYEKMSTESKTMRDLVAVFESQIPKKLKNVNA